MFFKSSTEKIYNLENRKQKIIKNLIKQDSELKELRLNELINLVVIHHMNTFRLVPNKLYNTEDLIDISKESKELLLEMFNMNDLYKMLDSNETYETKKFKNNDDFRRNIMKASLYQVISVGGKEKGPEYGLIFAKMFNFDLDIPMRYASYNGIYDERFMKYVDTYLELGGTDQMYWLPNYFKENNRDRYVMEPLYEIIDSIKGYISKNKVNSIN